jgi:hypothetical protein
MIATDRKVKKLRTFLPLSAECGFSATTVGASGDQDNADEPEHWRMRVFDHDLIRRGHYGARCWPSAPKYQNLIIREKL